MYCSKLGKNRQIVVVTGNLGGECCILTNFWLTFSDFETRVKFGKKRQILGSRIWSTGLASYDNTGKMELIWNGRTTRLGIQS